MFWKNWRVWLASGLIVLLAGGFLFSKAPLFVQARSYFVMYFYTKYQESQSLMDELDIRIDIPGGLSTKDKDWYPFMLVYNDKQGFSRYTGRDLYLTILYNFGAFDRQSSSSSFFQPDSPYYSSFYGGYIVKYYEGKRPYGFSPQGELITEEILAVPEYDFKYLVMSGLGCPESKLTIENISCQILSGVEYAGYDNWHKIDGLLKINSPNHDYRDKRRNYLQFGYPLKYPGQEDFGLITMQGRIYVRYFEESDSTVFLYIMTPRSDTLEECDRSILSKTVISRK
jgi:hypothetical protein